MPIIEIFVPAGVLDAEAKAKLHKNVGRQILEVEGGTGAPAERAISWVFHADARPRGAHFPLPRQRGAGGGWVTVA